MTHHKIPSASRCWVFFFPSTVSCSNIWSIKSLWCFSTSTTHIHGPSMMNRCHLHLTISPLKCLIFHLHQIYLEPRHSPHHLHSIHRHPCNIISPQCLHPSHIYHTTMTTIIQCHPITPDKTWRQRRKPPYSTIKLLYFTIIIMNFYIVLFIIKKSFF